MSRVWFGFGLCFIPSTQHVLQLSSLVTVVCHSGGLEKASTSSSSSLLPSSVPSLQVAKLKPETKLTHQGKREETGEKNEGKEIEEKEENVGKRKVTSNKILVRNVPFEATQKEVQELFQAFGGLKCVRLPKKLSGTGTHRGFGFVEFHTHHEAEVREWTRIGDELSPLTMIERERKKRGKRKKERNWKNERERVSERSDTHSNVKW